MPRKPTLKEQIHELKEDKETLKLQAKRLVADKEIAEMERDRIRKYSADYQLRILSLEALFQEEIAWLEAQQIPTTRDRAEYLRKEISK